MCRGAAFRRSTVAVPVVPRVAWQLVVQRAESLAVRLPVVMLAVRRQAEWPAVMPEGPQVEWLAETLAAPREE